jgi:lipoprotein-anchoring transpeptidase ErfK/SrfK
MPEIERLHLDVARQELIGSLGAKEMLRFPVSTASRGLGCREGSFQTPHGAHRVQLKIGAGLPMGAIFRGRRWTGEVLDEAIRRRFPDTDWVLTRILWLQGLECGVNRGGGVDTLRRFVYVHGTHEEDLVGRPASYGCVRMRNTDIALLFDRVPAGCPIQIE